MRARVATLEPLAGSGEVSDGCADVPASAGRSAEAVRDGGPPGEETDNEPCETVSPDAAERDQAPPLIRASDEHLE